MNKPDGVIEVYDNGGQTIDRYSIHFEVQGEEFLVCSSPYPFQSVCSIAESHQFDVGEHLGETIEWDELPEDVHKVVIQYMEVD